MTPSGTIVTTAPAAEPVTVEELKTHLRQDLADDDAYLEQLIVAARRFVEGWCQGHAFVQRGLETRFDCFPAAGRPLVLPVSPVISISSITYIDAAGAEQTWSTANYQTDTVSRLARVKPAYNKTWPITRRGDLGAVRVAYEAGYAPDDGSPTDYGANVPAEAKHVIKMVAGHWYDHPEAVTIGTVSHPIQIAVEHLLWQLRAPVVP